MHEKSNSRVLIYRFLLKFVSDAAGYPYALPQNEAANQVALPPSLAMMSLIPPPPPPGQSQSGKSFHLATLRRSYYKGISSL